MAGLLVAATFLLIAKVLCGQEASILSAPESVNAPLGATVKFICTATADFMDWKVDGRNALDIMIKMRGFHSTVYSVDSATNLKTGVLTAPALEGNNNTIVKCIATNDRPFSLDISNATLLIQGYLAQVSNLAVTSINSSTVLISWSPPFTLEGVPILGYNVTITNTTSGENETVFTRNTAVRAKFGLTTLWCTRLVIDVVSINQVGQGDSLLVIFYHPQIVPLTQNLTATVFVKNGSLMVVMSIKSTVLCPTDCPALSRVVVFEHSSEGEVVHLDPQPAPVFCNDEQSIVISINKSLPDGPVYLANATLEYRDGFMIHFSNIQIPAIMASVHFPCTGGICIDCIFPLTWTGLGCGLSFNKSQKQNVILVFRDNSTASTSSVCLHSLSNPGDHTLFVYEINDNGLVAGTPNVVIETALNNPKLCTSSIKDTCSHHITFSVEPPSPLSTPTPTLMMINSVFIYVATAVVSLVLVLAIVVLMSVVLGCRKSKANVDQDIQVEPNNAYMDLHELKGKVLPSSYNAVFKESEYEEIQQCHSDAYEDLETSTSISLNNNTKTDY